MNRIFATVERVMMGACIALLILVYIYVYGMGKIRGPFARHEFYKRGEIGDDEVALEQSTLGGTEKLKSAVESADTPP